jgi:hypothetical protein
MTIRLPVKCVDGQWELLYGGAVPVKPHTLAELRVDASSISDPHFLKSVTQKSRVRILAADQPLYIAISPSIHVDASLRKHLTPTIRHMHTAKISVHSQFVRVHLGEPNDAQKRRDEASGGLWLLAEGMTPCGLESSTVRLPDKVCSRNIATSLNHAFTLLSEVFEIDRLAHTGNIYEHVFYQDSDNVWYPLKDLRDRALASAERQVIRDLWQAVQAQMPSAQSGLFEQP